MDLQTVYSSAPVGQRSALIMEHVAPVLDGPFYLRTSSTASAAPWPVTSALPSAPVIRGTADPVRGSATVAWRPPADARSPITGYRVTRNGVDSKGTGAWSAVVPEEQRSFTFWNLVRDASYTLSVEALTEQGTGAPASAIVTDGEIAFVPASPRRSPGTGPTATALPTPVLAPTPPATAGPAAPSTPTGLTAAVDGTRRTATVSWAPPTADGGSAVTAYRVSRDGRDTKGTRAWSTVVRASERSFTFWNLVDGSDYVLEVEALNALGKSPAASISVTVGRTPVAPSSTSRQFDLQPFASTSIWNLPIGSGATFESARDPRTATLTGPGRVWVNHAQYSHPISQASTGDPMAVVTDTRDASRSGSYRVPPTAPIAEGTDAHMHVIDPEGRFVDEAFGVSRQNNASYTAGRHHTVDLQGSGMGPRNGTRAYGGSAIGGLVRAWEVDPTHPRYTGRIRHAVAIALRNDQLVFTPGGGVGYNTDGTMMQRGYTWPATEQDWDSPWTYSGNIPMGTYLAIPPSVDVTRLGLTPQGLMLARAYQDYGAYVTDRAGDMIMAYVEPSSAGGTFADALLGSGRSSSDVQRLRAELRIVTNNSPTAPNGAPLHGARRAQLLP